MAINPKRGEIWQVNLDPTIGQEIEKKRPVIVISSDIYNSIALRAKQLKIVSFYSTLKTPKKP
jgi:mRNA interferase MazF